MYARGVIWLGGRGAEDYMRYEPHTATLACRTPTRSCSPPARTTAALFTGLAHTLRRAPQACGEGKNLPCVNKQLLYISVTTPTHLDQDSCTVGVSCDDGYEGGYTAAARHDGLT